MDNETEEIKRKLARERRVRAMAYAFLKRGKEAGIPERFLRINKEYFESFLSPDYHPNPKSISDFVYNDTLELMKKPFILIDGGDDVTRKMAGYAVLFRIITYDKFGLYRTCENLNHRLCSWHLTDNVHRNDLAADLKQYDAMFVAEFDETMFKPHYEGGSFFDDIFSDRFDRLKPTIISFAKPLSSKKLIMNSESCGAYFSKFSVKEWASSYLDDRGHYQEGNKENPSDDTLRIRVRIKK